MSHFSKNPEDELRDTIRKVRAIIVAGTGVSMAASYDPATGKPHPQASWAGLLESGLEWLIDHKHGKPDVIKARLAVLRGEPTTEDFITTAAVITDKMSDSSFAHWLKETVGSIKAHDRRTLDALEALRQHGSFLATTNYDGLLLDASTSLTPVTWNDPTACVGVIRHHQTDRVLFLHGYWQRPKSVILDWKSYEEITRDEHYRDDLAAIWKTTTWVYVGCGMAGLNDPDFGLLLDRYGKRARGAGHTDFCLVREDQREEFQARFDDLQTNVRAVSFGKDYSDLPSFLLSLLPPPAPPSIAGAPVPAPPAVAAVSPDGGHVPIPKPPAFYAEPDYIGSHQFVGRDSQLQELSDWAKPADPTNLLLFEAIGGNGKSMLAWEWTTNHATKVRTGQDEWAGRFWYSFYEKGAIMADFCQRALAYMTDKPFAEFRKKKTAELAKELLAQLHARPWLLILDGLERVLVAYHRLDAAEVPDEEANAPTDKIGHRNPCDAIRDEDNDLLRSLAAAKPSKILVSSRLTPRVLLNRAGQPIPGAKRINLPGLRPDDAEKLLCSCGITGDSAAVQKYLTENCDNHPLVIGILGGLINNYLSARGNFDTWVADPEGGAKLDLAHLDLIQRRNHILHAALRMLPTNSAHLLRTLALLSESVDYDTLKDLNPHLPTQLEPIQWTYAKAPVARSEAVRREAAARLSESVADLERRGLLQYDRGTRRYDLHPVVRGVAAGGITATDREVYGQRVVDHFSSRSRRSSGQVETIEDVRPQLLLVRALLNLGRFDRAAAEYQSLLANALLFDVEAYPEVLSLLRPFFPTSWGGLARGVNARTSSCLLNDVAIALDYCGHSKEALAAYGAALRVDLEEGCWVVASIRLRNISTNLVGQNLLAKAVRVAAYAVGIAEHWNDLSGLFMGRQLLFSNQIRLGQWGAAEASRTLLESMDRPVSRSTYRPGDMECVFARSQFLRGTLREEHLDATARLVRSSNNRTAIRQLYELRGESRLEDGAWAQSAADFAEAIRMARESGIPNADAETGLALAKHFLSQLADPRQEAERLAELRHPAHRLLAQLWLARGSDEEAKKHALAAYRWAWADGEPYVHRYELTRTTELLKRMNVPIPSLPPYDPAKDERFPWEKEVEAAIAKP